MLSQTFALEGDALGRVVRALADVPRTAYSAPHVYPSAAPAYTEAPLAERPRLAADQLRLYVHVPFCRYHCTFCYFAVRVGAGSATMSRYVQAVKRELDWVERGTPLSQLFVGGGTPTALPADLLDEVLAAVFSRTRPSDGNVHTVEASPETLSAAHIEVLRRHGIRRVSLGVQTLDEGILGAVRREQTRTQALEACELLVNSGLIVNVDLIYGLPGQAEDIFLEDLGAVAAAGVPSLTLYSLRLNERTPVAKLLRDDERFDLVRLVRWRSLIKQAAEALGYTQTRWHTFKRLDTIAARHTRLPCFDDRMSGYQLGVGMSARSHLGHAVYRNHEQLNVYVDRVERGLSPVEHVFELAEEDRITQFVARTLGDGSVLVRAHYERTFGRAIDDDFGALLRCLVGAGLVADDGGALALSELGKHLYDLVTLAFYPPRARAWLAARGGWFAGDGENDV